MKIRPKVSIDTIGIDPSPIVPSFVIRYMYEYGYIGTIHRTLG
jgi:hypothetical protein